MLRAYKEFEQRVGTLKTQGSKSQHVRKTIEQIMGPFAISDIEQTCPSVSRDTIRMVLRQLRDEGALVSNGTGRNAKWTFQGYNRKI
jgi:hypothetical protein